MPNQSESSTPSHQQEIVAFAECRKALAAFHWNNDFKRFCEVTGFNPEHQYSQDKWQQFVTLVNAMGQFDNTCWSNLLSAALNQTSSSSK